MSKSLAELRQSPRVGLPERTYSLCLASTLVGEVQTLWAQLEDIESKEAAAANGDAAARPKRMGEGSDAAKVRARLSELRAEMLEHTGTLTLRGITEGEWRLWVDEHPARDDNERDAKVAYGICDADALLDDLGRYAKAWNGEDMGPGDWDFIKANAAAGDLKEIARTIVAMHEMTVDVPKLLSASLGTLDAEND